MTHQPLRQFDRTLDRRKLTIGATALTAATLASPRGKVEARQADAAGHVRAVVSSDRAATDAAMAILEAGGTAADAAIALASVLTVVEPYYSSVLGGDMWALYYEAATGEVTSLDGVGPTGSNATLDDYSPQAGEFGMHQAIVPGSWDAWMLWLDRYGRLDLGEVLAPAIEAARDGHPVSEEMARWLNSSAANIETYRVTSELYLPIPSEGDLQQQTAMADTFDALVQAYDDAAAESRSAGVRAARDHFYLGPIAEAIVAFSDATNGYFTMEDFETFEAQIVAPISIAWDNALTVYENPPGSQGVTMLLGLNILKTMDLGQYDRQSADAIHLQVEALKLAFADREAHVADPSRAEIDILDLLNDEHAATQRDRIDMDSALEWPIGEARRRVSHTTTFQVVDGEGNAAAVTTSLGAQFLVVGDTGIHINHRMEYLSLESDNINVVAPGAKIRHTSCPYMVLRDGRPYILGGNTGVDTQPQGQLQQFLSTAVWGLGAQDAVSAPRFVTSAFPYSTFPHDVDNTLQMQDGFDDDVIVDLQNRGHNVVVGEGIFASANTIHLSEDGLTADTGIELATSQSAEEVVEP